jgi:hypothetical protein
VSAALIEVTILDPPSTTTPGTVARAIEPCRANTPPDLLAVIAEFRVEEGCVSGLL